MSDEDLADAAVRFAIRYLVHSGGNLKIAKAAALVEEAAKRVAADVVAEARTQRYSWGRIAQHFGVGRTAVQKRFGAWPTAERAQALEDQYLRMGHYLKSAELNPGTYENEDEVRETRSRCIRRRRGHALDPIDQLHKVLPRRHRETQPPSE
jgi:CO/xanthine dehydrogenase Mo-binding subunit